MISVTANRHDVLEPSTALVRRGQAPGGHVGISQIGGVDEDTPPETPRVNSVRSVV
jgi:hypothetical protein